MSLMDRVEQAISRLKSSNEQLSGARNSCSYRSHGDAIACGVNNQLNKLKEKLLELPVDVGKGAREAVKDELSGLWNTVTNPIETAKDVVSGVKEAVRDPEQALEEAWNDLKEPYEEDWENGHPGQAIGRGLVEVGQMAIPGWGIVKGGEKALDVLKGLGKGDDGPSNDDSNRNKDDGAGNDDSDSDKSDKTVPSGQEGDAPSGTPTRIDPNERDPNNIRALTRENESAVTLANTGYKVEQNPNVEGLKNPDYKIEGKIADCYAPSTPNARNIASYIQDKVEADQADRIILNLDDSNVKLNDLKQQLTNYPVSGLKEIIVLKNGEVTPFFP